MTEQEYLACTDPQRMLGFLLEGQPGRRRSTVFARPSDRRLRLFACACARQAWHLLTDDTECAFCCGSGRHHTQPAVGPKAPCPHCQGAGRVNRSRRAVEVAERYADGLATEEEVKAARDSGYRAVPYGPNYTVHDLPGIALSADVARMLAEHTIWTTDFAPPAAQAALLRDLIGDPFRPVTQPPGPTKTGPGFAIHEGCPWLTWQEGVVVRLAQAAYSDGPGRLCGRCEGKGSVRWQGPPPECGRETCPDCHATGRIEDGTLDPARLLVLADALEEAGCEDADILGHLRGPGPHARGCHVLDLLLGRS